MPVLVMEGEEVMPVQEFGIDARCRLAFQYLRAWESRLSGFHTMVDFAFTVSLGSDV